MTKFNPPPLFQPRVEKNFDPPPLLPIPPSTKKLDPPTSILTMRLLEDGQRTFERESSPGPSWDHIPPVLQQYAQSHPVHWTQEHDQEEGLHED